MTTPAVEELKLPETAEACRHAMNTASEVAKWIRAGKLSQLQDHYNELTRPELPKQMTDIMQSFMDSQGMIEDKVRTVFDEVLRDRGVFNRPAMPRGEGNSNASPPRGMVYNDYARRMDDIGFASTGEFIKEVWHKNVTPTDKLQRAKQVKNEFSSIDPSLGGFLLPESFSGTIRTLSLERSIIRPRASVVPMTAPIMHIPSLDWTTNVGSVLGGFAFDWLEEAEEKPESSPTFGRVDLRLWKLGGRTDIPDEMFQDVPNLTGFINNALPRALAFIEDAAFINGNGVGKPLGILNSPARILANRTGSPLNTDDVLNMYAQMLPSSLDNAIWLANPTLFPAIMTLTIDVGTGGAPVMLAQGGLPGGPPATILGRPLILTEKVPASGSRGDLSFVDPSYYLIADNGAVAVESSPHARFTADVTVVRVVERVDGRSWISAPFQPLNGDPLSPFVVLDT